MTFYYATWTKIQSCSLPHHPFSPPQSVKTRTLTLPFRPSTFISWCPRRSTYIRECYPQNCFTATDRNLLSPHKQAPGYGKSVGLRSMSFADATFDPPGEPPVFNAFQ